MSLLRVLVVAMGIVALADAIVLTALPSRRRDRARYGGAAAYAVHAGTVGMVGLALLLLAGGALSWTLGASLLILAGAIDLGVGIAARRRQRGVV